MPECEGQLQLPLDAIIGGGTFAGQVGMDSPKFDQDDNLEVWGDWAIDPHDCPLDRGVTVDTRGDGRGG